MISIFMLITFLIFSIKYFKYDDQNIRIAYRLNALVFILLILNFLIILLGSGLDNLYIGQFRLKKSLISIVYILTSFIKIFITIFLIHNFRKTKIINYFKAFLITVGIFCILFVFTFLYSNKNYGLYKADGSKYEVGVVLGAAVWSDNKPSTMFKYRLNKSLKLFQSGKVRKIFLTGGRAPGELSEAEVGKNYLEGKGIMNEYMEFENQTGTTLEQIRFIKKELSEKYNSKILIVSDSFHLGRVCEMNKFFNLDVDVVESDTSFGVKNYFYYKVRDTIALILFWFFAI